MKGGGTPLDELGIGGLKAGGGGVPEMSILAAGPRGGGGGMEKPNFVGWRGG